MPEIHQTLENFGQDPDSNFNLDHKLKQIESGFKRAKKITIEQIKVWETSEKEVDSPPLSDED
jgi:hypothetical protein